MHSLSKFASLVRLEDRLDDDRDTSGDTSSVHVPRSFWGRSVDLFTGLFSRKSTSKFRTVYCNMPTDVEHPGNYISTTKYTVLTFIPKFLYEQFSKASNVVFLIISIFQMIPNISPSGKYTTIMPLAFMTFLSAIKEIVEDFKRMTSDKNTNNSAAIVFRNGIWTSVKWHEIVVGDIIRVIADERVPADICLLSTSDENSICYVETCSLDGETNQKIRQASKQTCHIKTDEQVASFKACLECDLPNNRIYQFNGKMTIYQVDGTEETLAVSNDQIILRGCIVRNTLFVFGTVVYTGHESKIMLNSSASPIKKSNVEKNLNNIIIFLVVILLLTSLALAFRLQFSIYPQVMKSHWFYKITSSSYEGFVSFLFFFVMIFILLHNIIPISLNVSLEAMKLMHCYFICQDIDLYDEETDTPAQAKTSSVVEELGQINFIFTDKTGTLTDNVMELMQLSINGRVYGLDNNSREEFDVGVKRALLSQETSHVDEFLVGLSVCNTIRSQFKGDKWCFHSSSPDEVALAEGINRCGYTVGGRTSNTLEVIVNGDVRQFELLNVIDFTSDRKRMSVIVRHEGMIKIFCKGADSVILERLRSGVETQQILDDLDKFAKSGYRTLVIASATIPEMKYKEWEKIYYDASVAIFDREKLLSDAYELVENNFNVLGATAIEDRLQENVFETVVKLSQAKIRFVMLTGDRVETAINIGYSTGMLRESLAIEVMANLNEDGCITMLTELIQTYDLQVAWDDRKKQFIQPATTKELAIVIDGVTLQHALKRSMMKQFLVVLLSCRSVICSRVSPSQKSEMVKLVTQNVIGAVSLAIGDGANDCPMIQAAHVGIGITGKEGMQAANVSDFSIAKFRFLVILLLFHGQTSYRRVCSAILYSFYKGTILNFISFFYLFYNLESGDFIFDHISYMLYNVIFSAALPFIFGIFLQVSKKDALLNFPSCYQTIRSNKIFNLRVFTASFLNGIVHAAVLFFFTYYCCIKQIMSPNAIPVSKMFVGQMLYTATMIIITVKATLQVQFWNMPSTLMSLFGIASWIMFMLVSSRKIWFFFFQSPLLFNLDLWMFGNTSFYLWLLLGPFLTVIMDMIVMTFKNTWFPAYHLIVNEAISAGQVNLECDVSLQNAIHHVDQRKERVRNRRQKYLGFAYSFTDDNRLNKLFAYLKPPSI